MKLQISEVRKQLGDIQGIHVVPFREDGAVDEEALVVHLQNLSSSGIPVIVTCGNTGEFYSLSLEEARSVTRIAVKTVGDRALMVGGIGYDTATAAEMGLYAEECGAQALMLHQPVHPFQSERGYFEYVKAISMKTKLPLLLYVKIPLSPEWFPRLADLDGVIGVKYAVPDPLAFAEAVRTETERLVWICGLAEMWAPLFAEAGATGWTSGLVNVAPAISIGMRDALEQGDKERLWKLWHLAVPFEKLRARYHDGNNVSVVKEAMAQLGLGPRHVRPPIHELPAEERAEVDRILRTLASY
ncbi:dihydrodipicolinate synthase family protein [Paenibacillus solisilvae]|uniref:Dihydrodipicolinate synthase family protein n=1 Tax=Paenibacillus solisilvae TaxID=2486751 RepID=A0ABW0W0L2_9BACL